MSGKFSKNKGANAEREAAALIVSWLEPVYSGAGLEPPTLSRNLEQVRSGGYDLVGLDWLALEVKRHENLQIESWWKQTVAQAGPGQLPVLMFRQNRSPWRFKAVLHHYTCGYLVPCESHMKIEAAKKFLQYEAFSRLMQTTPDGITNV